jgi:hypothetical protein
VWVLACRILIDGSSHLTAGLQFDLSELASLFWANAPDPECHLGKPSMMSRRHGCGYSWIWIRLMEVRVGHSKQK